MKHSKYCLHNAAARERAIVTWKTHWPEHCQHCEARTDSGDPCVWCLLQGICPRCGREGTIDEEDASIPCSICGWMETEDDRLGCPEPWQCICSVGKYALEEIKLNAMEAQRMELDESITKQRKLLRRLRNENRDRQD